MKALIDGDVIRYRVGFACETHHYDIYIKGDEHLGPVSTATSAKDRDSWIEDKIGSKDDVTIKERFIPDKLENCLHSVKLQIEFILNRVAADSFIIYLSGEGNFREDLVDYYKANRKDSRKPIYYPEITEYLIKHWNAEVINGQEADDALGIEQYKNITKDPKYQRGWNYKSIICSIDKDLDNIPGPHFNFVKDEKYWVDEDEAMRNFYSQLLTGDQSDNIPGLYKITGRRCNKKLLEPIAYCETEKDMWEYVKSIYLSGCDKEHNGYILNEAYFKDKLTETGQLLWIRREEGELWKPPIYNTENKELK